MSAENPYTAPALVAENEIEKPDSTAWRRIAMRSWQYPLVGILAALLGALPEWDSFLPWLGLLLFFLSLIVGFVLSIVSLIAARKYPRVLGPAVAGLLCTILLASPFLVVLMIDLMRMAG